MRSGHSVCPHTKRAPLVAHDKNEEVPPGHFLILLYWIQIITRFTFLPELQKYLYRFVPAFDPVFTFFGAHCGLKHGLTGVFGLKLAA